MYRFLGLASILVLAALQTGCCISPCGKGMGCGRTYWGAYYDDPPTCEPCDKCGNWTGGNRTQCKDACKNGCEDQCEFNWKRGQKVSLLGGLFNCDLFDCPSSGSCTEPSCAEPSCAEPSCAEPDCAYNRSASYESAGYSSRSPRTSNVSYTANNWSGAKTSGCNCGKH